MSKSDKLFLDLIEALSEEYQFFKDAQQKLIKEDQQEQEEEKYGDTLLDFSTALKLLKSGEKVARFSWDDPVYYVMTKGVMGPYIVRKDPIYPSSMPVTITYEDLFADDWCIFKE